MSRENGKLTLDLRASNVSAVIVGGLNKARKTMQCSEKQLGQKLCIDVQTVKRLEQGIGSVEVLIGAMSALKFKLAGIAGGGHLGEQLAARRRQRGLALEQVADKTQLSTTKIANLEKGVGLLPDLFKLIAEIAPQVRCRLKRANWGESDTVDRDSRFTCPEFLEAVYDAFGEIDLDPCAHPMSSVVANRRIILSEGGNGLFDTWSGQLAFVNPPFSAQLDWLERAYEQNAAGNVQTVICLVPVKTCNTFFHSTLHKAADLYVLKGRPRFADVNGKWEATKYSLMVVAFGASYEQKARFAKLVPGLWLRASACTPRRLEISSYRAVLCVQSQSKNLFAVACGHIDVVPRSVAFSDDTCSAVSSTRTDGAASPRPCATAISNWSADCSRSQPYEMVSPR
jgi:transcriptional regulator with XRE-family HTH domain